MPEQRIVLQNCGTIDPGKIGSYVARDGFKALEKARSSMTPQQVIDEVKASGLRGRGGAGFPCGLKWDLASKSAGSSRYVICNADEGEIGTFKDRYIIENDPFSLVEAVAIACYALGAERGYIYLRAEYRFLLPRLLDAIAQAGKGGHLGDIRIEVRQGAGAYVCGEESALMDSIEGKRGEVRFKPPFPPTSGLWEKPTVINNVETLMNIPSIIRNGAEWFNRLGTEKSKGTKVFSVCGDVERPGVYEMVLGSPLRDLVEGMAGGGDIQVVQIGGATGRLLPASGLDMPLAFESVLGAGAVIVYNNSRDIIDIVYRTVDFLAEESCGKCTPCREGTEVMREVYERLVAGEGRKNDIRVLEELSTTMALASLCGLGQAVPVPVTDSLTNFRAAYEARIK